MDCDVGPNQHVENNKMLSLRTVRKYIDNRLCLAGLDGAARRRAQIGYHPGECDQAGAVLFRRGDDRGSERASRK